MVTESLPGTSDHQGWLEGHARSLTDFYSAALDPSGGFAWLGIDGVPDPTKPRDLWMTCRFIHSYGLAQLLGDDSATPAVDHGLDFLQSTLADNAYGGWFASRHVDGTIDAAKETYGQAFVTLAASTALVAGHDTNALLLNSLEVGDRLFDVAEGLYADSADRAWGHVDPYRGVNANMHMTEALLAASAVLDDESLGDRARTIVRRVLGGFAQSNDWRLPEHFDSTWHPLLDYNIESPRNKFRPFGSSVGHWFEWARLAVQASVNTAGNDEFVGWATRLFERGMREGHRANRFVFSVDWSGRQFDTDQYHWVTTEAIGAADALAKATGSEHYRDVYFRLWDEARENFIDDEAGGWFHQLNAEGALIDTVWSGKPDLYHAFQATVFARVGLSSDLASAIVATSRHRGVATFQRS